MVDNNKIQLDWIAQQRERMREELLRLADLNSGSFNADGVNAVGARMRALLDPMSDVTEVLAVAPYRTLDDRGAICERPLGAAYRFRCRPQAPLRILLAGHLDTVFGPEHPFQKTRELAPDVLNGPGVADLKGGLLVLYLALSALERSPQRDRIGWEVLLNPDEEIGSEGSAPLFRDAAARHHLGLVFEPSLPDGSLASTRKGSGNFTVILRGRAAHAGRAPEAGRNALRAAADVVLALDALNGQREGVTLNPGYIHGGGPLNIVPDLCLVKFNVRTRIAADEAWLRERLDAIEAEIRSREGFAIEVHGSFTRPPKPMTQELERLIGLLQDCGAALNQPLAFKPTGGCCDGNNLAAAGLPNVDNLGVVGGEIHSEREFMRFSSLIDRAQLVALLLLRLASGELTWH